MINKDFHIAELISRYLSEAITPEEEATLNDWRESSPNHEKLFQEVCRTENLVNYLQASNRFDKVAGWEQLNQKLRFTRRRNHLYQLGKYAAVLIVPFLVGLLTVIALKDNDLTVAEQIDEQQFYILPGEKKAVLTMGNGATVDLKANPETTLQEEDGTSISIDADALNYELTEVSPVAEKEIYNKIDVPHGGEYSLMLSDGTKVYLNAMSSLRFPVRFINNQRVVELEGEAYFEVAKSSKPFIVKVDQMEVEVLGTCFNVSSYKGEKYQTTLVEGSVKVQTPSGANCILQPSEQAYLKPDSNELGVRKVDVMQYTSWVNGKIYFKDSRLEDIMNTLSRWYDIDVFYLEPSVKNLRFGCNVNRYKEITPFLELLEKTEKVDIVIKGKTITFKHNN